MVLHFKHFSLSQNYSYSHHTGYDQSAATDQYSQGYSAPAQSSGYGSNGYSQSAYPTSASGYAPTAEYDTTQYQQDYRYCTNFN